MCVDEELLRCRRKNQLRESSPSGRSSGGIESGIDVSSVTLDQWDRVCHFSVLFIVSDAALGPLRAGGGERVDC